MKLGIVSLWRTAVADFVDEVATADELGLDLIGVGDSQSGFRELYVSLAVAAGASRRALIGPMVTNPVTRHAAVTVSAMSSVDAYSNGRAVLGIGTGGSAVWTIGSRPATVADLRDYVVAMRAMMRTGSAEIGGRQATVQHVSRQIPIWITAEGPRTLRLAGAIADGVVLHGGTSAEAVSWSLERVADGAREVGRDPAEIEVWMMLKASIAESRDVAVHEALGGLAGSAEHALRSGAAEKGVPEHQRDAVAELVRRYDPSTHATAGGANARLVEELGLADLLVQLFGLIGTPSDCVDKLLHLERLGVQGVICPAIGQDPLQFIHQLGSEVAPAVRRAAPPSTS